VVRPVLEKADDLLAVLERYQAAAHASAFGADELLLDLWQQTVCAAVAVENEMDRLGFGPHKQIDGFRGHFGALCALDRWLKGMRMGTRWRPAAEDERQQPVTEDEACRDTWGTPVLSGHWRADLTNMPDASKVLAKLRVYAGELRRDFGQAASQSQTTTPQGENPPTIWYYGDLSYSADGQHPRKVSREMHNLLKAFLNKDQAIDTPGLEDAGVSNVTTVITKVEKIFGAATVRRPGRSQKGAGYYVRVRTCQTATQLAIS
jgi:hypothetical protein